MIETYVNTSNGGHLKALPCYFFNRWLLGDNLNREYWAAEKQFKFETVKTPSVGQLNLNTIDFRSIPSVNG